ncbi:MAG: hypothetical protein WBB29_20060 [Geitlerinemataceae cyanobacterium]
MSGLGSYQPRAVIEESVSGLNRNPSFPDSRAEIPARSLYNANDRLKLYPKLFNAIKGDC